MGHRSKSVFVSGEHPGELSMSDDTIINLETHDDYQETRPHYEAMCADLQKVLKKYDHDLFAHEKIAALETLKYIIMVSECLEIQN